MVILTAASAAHEGHSHGEHEDEHPTGDGASMRRENLTGGASGQRGVRPYGNGAEKVRWMALTMPAAPVEPKGSNNLDSEDVEDESRYPPEILNESGFSIELQRVTDSLKDLVSAVQNLELFHFEDMATLLRGESAKDPVLSAPDEHGDLCKSTSMREEEAEAILTSKMKSRNEVIATRVSPTAKSTTSSKRGWEGKMVSSQSLTSQGIRSAAGRFVSRTPLKMKTVELGDASWRNLSRSNSQSGLITFDLRPAWCADVEDYKEDMAPMPSMRISAVGSRLATMLRHEGTRFGVGVVGTDHRAGRPHLILHPHGAVRMFWNLLCLLAIAYDIIMVPLEAFPLGTHRVVDIVEWFLTILWTTDMFVSFRTAFFIGSTLETGWKQIGRNYLRTWFVVDLTIITLEWMARLSDAATGFGSILRTSRVFRTLRCIRLLRLGKLKGLLSVVEDQINSGLASLAFGLLKLVIILGIMVHAITCIWYAVGDGQPDGWVTYYAPSITGPRDVFFWYFASSRWTLAQINGRTDMDERRNIVELGYTCLIAIGFAVVFMALFISSITTTMMELSSIAENKFNTHRMVGEYMAGNYVSHRLACIVKRHIKELQGVEDESLKENKIMSLLPRQMANDLLYEVRSPTLSRNEFFYHLKEEYPRTLRHVCHKAVRAVPAHRWEVVFDKGDACSRMLFIDKGEMMYSETNIHWKPDFADLDNGPPGESLRRGAWVSEAALWIEWRNQGKLTAGCHSVLLSTEFEEFSGVMHEYKDAYVRAVTYAVKLIGELSKLEKLSDMISLTPAYLHPSGSSMELSFGRRHSRIGE